MLTKKKTLHGPGGLRLILDPAQVFPDDPGQGTPALVELGGHTATFWCAQAEGELDGPGGPRLLTDAQSEWLNVPEIESAVEELYG